MTWAPTAAELLGLLSMILLIVTARMWVSLEHVRRVMHVACRKSVEDHNDYVRIPRNQVIEMMKWEGVYELRPAGYEFKGKPSFRHPSTLSPWRRRKLGSNK